MTSVIDLKIDKFDVICICFRNAKNGHWHLLLHNLERYKGVDLFLPCTIFKIYKFKILKVVKFEPFWRQTYDFMYISTNKPQTVTLNYIFKSFVFLMIIQTSLIFTNRYFLPVSVTSVNFSTLLPALNHSCLTSYSSSAPIHFSFNQIWPNNTLCQAEKKTILFRSFGNLTFKCKKRAVDMLLHLYPLFIRLYLRFNDFFYT